MQTAAVVLRAVHHDGQRTGQSAAAFLIYVIFVGPYCSTKFTFIRYIRSDAAGSPRTTGHGDGAGFCPLVVDHGADRTRPYLVIVMIERRAVARTRMLKSGKIVLGKHTIPCTVRNLSTAGACVQVQTTSGLPAAFNLVMENQPPRLCRTIWRDDTRIGIKFEPGA